MSGLNLDPAPESLNSHDQIDQICDLFEAQLKAGLRPELSVLLHATPNPRATVAFTGVDPAAAARSVDGLVVSCWRGTDALPAAVAGGGPVYASLLAIAGMGGGPRGLPEQAAAARAAGASGVRLYHVGLAGAADLTAVRELTSRIHKGE